MGTRAPVHAEMSMSPTSPSQLSSVSKELPPTFQRSGLASNGPAQQALTRVGSSQSPPAIKPVSSPTQAPSSNSLLPTTTSGPLSTLVRPNDGASGPNGQESFSNARPVLQPTSPTLVGPSVRPSLHQPLLPASSSSASAAHSTMLSPLSQAFPSNGKAPEGQTLTHTDLAPLNLKDLDDKSVSGTPNGSSLSPTPLPFLERLSTIQPQIPNPLANKDTETRKVPNSTLQSEGSSGDDSQPLVNSPTGDDDRLLDHRHLQPGEMVSLLSHKKTLDMYRENAKKTNDPQLNYELAIFMLDVSRSLEFSEQILSRGQDPAAEREHLAKEAVNLLRRLADRGHVESQYLVGDCFMNGYGLSKGRPDLGLAYSYFTQAGKRGHPDAAYRAGTCYEKGWGCRRDQAKAVQFYKMASSRKHPGAQYRLGTAELNGELGLKRSAREGVKWLKRSAENATPEFPHALHELALLHEKGIYNVLFVDYEYSCELLAQAVEMGYAPSAYKLGVNYEYGRMGCPQDSGLSIHMYNIAAQQNHKEACFALTAWYLVGAPGILPQSDTEAYLWAKRAAEQGLAKAEYACGYFSENGIGTARDLSEAKGWYQRAVEHGDSRASSRLNTLSGYTAKQVGSAPDESATRNQPKAIPVQPLSAPFPSAAPMSTMRTLGVLNYPTPKAMRETQAVQRDMHQQALVAAIEERDRSRSDLSSPQGGSFFGPGWQAGRLPNKPFSPSQPPKEGGKPMNLIAAGPRAGFPKPPTPPPPEPEPEPEPEPDAAQAGGKHRLKARVFRFGRKNKSDKGAELPEQAEGEVPASSSAPNVDIAADEPLRPATTQEAALVQSDGSNPVSPTSPPPPGQLAITSKPEGELDNGNKPNGPSQALSLLPRPPGQRPGAPLQPETKPQETSQPGQAQSKKPDETEPKDVEPIIGEKPKEESSSKPGFSLFGLGKKNKNKVSEKSSAREDDSKASKASRLPPSDSSAVASPGPKDQQVGSDTTTNPKLEPQDASKTPAQQKSVNPSQSPQGLQPSGSTATWTQPNRSGPPVLAGFAPGRPPLRPQQGMPGHAKPGSPLEGPRQAMPGSLVPGHPSSEHKPVRPTPISPAHPPDQLGGPQHGTSHGNFSGPLPAAHQQGVNAHSTSGPSLNGPQQSAGSIVALRPPNVPPSSSHAPNHTPSNRSLAETQPVVPVSATPVRPSSGPVVRGSYESTDDSRSPGSLQPNPIGSTGHPRPASNGRPGVPAGLVPARPSIGTSSGMQGMHDAGRLTSMNSRSSMPNPTMSGQPTASSTPTDVSHEQARMSMPNNMLQLRPVSPTRPPAALQPSTQTPQGPGNPSVLTASGQPHVLRSPGPHSPSSPTPTHQEPGHRPLIRPQQARPSPGSPPPSMMPGRPPVGPGGPVSPQAGPRQQQPLSQNQGVMPTRPNFPPHPNMAGLNGQSSPRGTPQPHLHPSRIPPSSSHSYVRPPSAMPPPSMQPGSASPPGRMPAQLHSGRPMNVQSRGPGENQPISKQALMPGQSYSGGNPSIPPGMSSQQVGRPSAQMGRPPTAIMPPNQLPGRPPIANMPPNQMPGRPIPPNSAPGMTPSFPNRPGTLNPTRPSMPSAVAPGMQSGHMVPGQVRPGVPGLPQSGGLPASHNAGPWAMSSPVRPVENNTIRPSGPGSPPHGTGAARSMLGSPNSVGTDIDKFEDAPSAEIAQGPPVAGGGMSSPIKPDSNMAGDKNARRKFLGII